MKTQLSMNLKYLLFKFGKKLLGQNRYLKLRYFQRKKDFLNLSTPQLFSEKIQWLKIHDKREIYTHCADKLKAKEIVGKLIGKNHVIEPIFIYDNVEDIKLNQLPDYPIIVKTNHDSGGVFVINDKKDINLSVLKRKLKKKLKTNFYYANLEWEYKNIEPKVFIEKILTDNSGNLLLNDYKIHCFNGEPLYIQTINDRREGVKETWYNRNWQIMDIWYFSSKSKPAPAPKTLDKMLQISKVLSKEFPYVRIDLYDVNDNVYFGEFTFRPYGGFMNWNDPKWDKKLGEHLNLKMK